MSRRSQPFASLYPLSIGGEVKYRGCHIYILNRFIWENMGFYFFSKIFVLISHGTKSQKMSTLSTDHVGAFDAATFTPTHKSQTGKSFNSHWNESLSVSQESQFRISFTTTVLSFSSPSTMKLLLASDLQSTSNICLCLDESHSHIPNCSSVQ